MPTTPNRSTTARQVCEALLRAERADLIEKSIWPSFVKIIDRLLERGLELEDAYEELHSKLADHPPALKVFFEQLQSTASLWSPEANREARKDRARLIEVNREIEDTARTLAALLDERTELKNKSGFSCDTMYHPLDVIHAAAKHNHSYGHWVKEELDATRRFDLKYWPSLAEVVQAIADDAVRAEPIAHDVVTQAGTEGSRGGLADTFKAFFAAIDDASARKFGFLPQSFELTDRSAAILMSCALGLGPDETVDAPFVKRLRQRQRERSTQA